MLPMSGMMFTLAKVLRWQTSDDPGVVIARTDNRR